MKTKFVKTVMLSQMRCKTTLYIRKESCNLPTERFVLRRTLIEEFCIESSFSVMKEVKFPEFKRQLHTLSEPLLTKISTTVARSIGAL